MNPIRSSISISPIRTSREANITSPTEFCLSTNHYASHTQRCNDDNVRSNTSMYIKTRTPMQNQGVPPPPPATPAPHNHQQDGTKKEYNRPLIQRPSDEDHDENLNNMNHNNYHHHHHTAFDALTQTVGVDSFGRLSSIRRDHRFVLNDFDAPSDEQPHNDEQREDGEDEVEDESIYEMRCIHRIRQPSLGAHGEDEVENRDSNRYDSHTNDADEEAVEGEHEESEEERRIREEEESIALARQLMAEEAMSSYAQSSNFLRAHANEYSGEDLRALEALMAEEDPMNEDAVEEVDHDEEDGSNELSYETLLRLGEQMGDVKTERWTLKAEQEIQKLNTLNFCFEMAKGKDENDCCVKCLVCQFQYEDGDCMRVLPCKHRFHSDCVDQWLRTKDHCPYCRQSIVVK